MLDRDLGPRRRKLLSPLVGKGIFTSDGEAWEHSRVSLHANLHPLYRRKEHEKD
jgi:hypothetical protein